MFFLIYFVKMIFINKMYKNMKCHLAYSFRGNRKRRHRLLEDNLNAKRIKTSKSGKPPQTFTPPGFATELCVRLKPTITTRCPTLRLRLEGSRDHFLTTSRNTRNKCYIKPSGQHAIVGLNLLLRETY